MANGDKAAAAGMDIVAGTDDLRDSFEEHNKTRDYIADGLLGDIAAEQVASGELDLARIPALPASKITSGSLAIDGYGTFAAAWNYNVVTTRRSVWMDANGTLGQTASSKRFKKNIRAAQIDLEALLGIPVRTFEYRKGGETDTGLIAEDLAGVAGCEFLVDRDPDGTIHGIHYERLSVALMALVQNLAARVAKLEGGK